MREEEIPYLTAAKKRGLLTPDDPPTEAKAAEPYRIRDFVRSGAASSWFVSGPEDGALRSLMKKGLALAMRSRPQLYEGCTGCGHCARLCPAHAITIKNKKAVIDRKKCVRCFCCQEFCPSGAMRVRRSLAARLLGR